MKKLSEEELITEFNRFKTNAISCGVWDCIVDAKLETDLLTGVCGLSNDTGCAYPGSLLVHVNYVIAIASRIANMISATFQIDQTSMTKCCILQHIGKLQMFEVNTNEWEVKNRGLVNKFTQNNASLKCGVRSLFIAMQHGVTLTEEEVEAITCLDKEANGTSAFDNIMTIIIRQANELAYKIEKEKYGKI